MVTDQLSWGKYIKRRVSHYTVINIIDHLHGAYLPENSCNMVSGVYTYGRRAIMEVDGVLHSTTLPPSQFVFYGQGPNVPLGKPNTKLFVIVPLLSSSLHTSAPYAIYQHVLCRPRCRRWAAEDEGTIRRSHRAWQRGRQGCNFASKTQSLPAIRTSGQTQCKACQVDVLILMKIEIQ